MSELYFTIPNLDKFQHYKDRCPPWIKLHASVLDDYDFNRLQDASKAHLLLIWVLASRTNGPLPYDPRWVAQRIGASAEEVDLDALRCAGFITYDDASEALAGRLPCATQRQSRDRAETEAEGETDARERAGSGGKRHPLDEVIAESLEPVPDRVRDLLERLRRHRAERGKPLGETGYRAQLRMALDDPAAYEAALAESEAQGWTSVNPKKGKAGGGFERLSTREASDRRHREALKEIFDEMEQREPEPRVVDVESARPRPRLAGGGA